MHNRLPRWAEPAAILLVMLGVAVVARNWPTEVSVGRLSLWVALLFLVQTLIRDLVLLWLSNRDKSLQKEQQCFSLESGIGVILLVAGLVLFVSNAGGKLMTGHIFWIASISITLWLNYWMRDLVFSWNPWRVYRDPDHLNIVPRLKSG